MVNPDFNMIGSGAPEGGFAPLVLVRNAARGAAIHVIPDALPAARRLSASHTLNPQEQNLHETLTAIHGGSRRYNWPIVHTDAHDTAWALRVMVEFPDWSRQ